MMPSATSITRSVLLTTAAVTLPTLLACLDHPVRDVTLQSHQEEQEAIAISANKDVDILFVIDNSGSMGEEQANISENFSRFIGRLEDDDVEANYRIGITTTDNGNPRCPGTTPEGGKMRTIPCVDRLGEFQFTDTDASNACTGFCPAGMSGLETTDGKPWFQRIEGVTNLPDDVTTTQAFQCFGPQGIDGCGFESPLEAMYKALRRSGESGDNQEGFLREGAILAVVFVTDELDCSHNGDHDSIFDPDGMRTFWSDPQAAQPSSAVCWNAGVECVGDSPYEECYAVNKGVDGTVGVPDSEAVLRPVSRYVDLLQRFEDHKQKTFHDQEVLVAVISGVPTGYAQGQADIDYRDAADAEFQEQFGIGPGCSNPDVAEALPPVRLREFAESFQVEDDEPNLYSVCNPSYADALDSIADAIAEQVRPACMPRCVADLDLETPGLDPQCELEQEAPGADTTPLRECIYTCGGERCDRSRADGFEYPAGEDVCFRMLTDADESTPSSHDDMDGECIDAGNNLQFEIHRQAPAPAGTTVRATCTLSDLASIDCPAL